MAKKPKAVYAIEDGEVLAGIQNADKIDPQALGEALQRLRDKDGEIRPERLVAEARANPRHPAHQHFQWDIEKAAMAHWLDQARCLIRIVRVEHAEEFYRAFVSVPKDTGRAYVTLSDVLNNRELQDALLAQAERDLEVWRQRYRELREIVELVRPALNALAKKRGKSETRETPINSSPT